MPWCGRGQSAWTSQGTCHGRRHRGPGIERLGGLIAAAGEIIEHRMVPEGAHEGSVVVAWALPTLLRKER
jgi:hypothetical protein